MGTSRPELNKRDVTQLYLSWDPSVEWMQPVGMGTATLDSLRAWAALQPC